MYFARSFLVALISAPFLALAQDKPNPFTNTAYNGVTAGKSFTLTWKPTTEGTVSLILRSGNSGDLSQGTPIASHIANSGSYMWNVPADTPRGSSYTVEIVDDSDSSETNYTPQFVLDSTNNSPLTTASSSGSMTMSSMSASSTSMTGSSASMSSSMSMSMSMSMTGSSSSSMMTSTMTNSDSSSMASSSSSSEAGLVATGSSSTSSGGAAKATAMAGMLGMVALGALAL